MIDVMEGIDKIMVYGNQIASPEHEELFKQYDTVHGWFRIEGGRHLYNFAKNPYVPGICVEIGNFKGKSTMFMGLGAKAAGTEVLAIDPHPRSIADEFNKGVRTLPEFFENIIKYNMENTIIPVVARSDLVMGPFDPEYAEIKLLHIDGEHTTEAVAMDGDWLDYVAPGGVVRYDDCNIPEVKEGMDLTIRELVDFVELEPGYFVRIFNTVTRDNLWWKHWEK